MNEFADRSLVFGWVVLVALPVVGHAAKVVSHNSPSHYESVAVGGVSQLTEDDFMPGQIGLADSARIHGAHLVQPSVISPAQIYAQPSQKPDPRDTSGSGSATSHTIDSCSSQSLSTPGTYVLTSDIGEPPGYWPFAGCLTISHTSGPITIDCQGHSMTSFVQTITLDHADNVTIQNCTLLGSRGGFNGISGDASNSFKLIHNQLGAVHMGNALNGAIIDNDVKVSISLMQCSNTHVVDNRINLSIAQENYGIWAYHGHDNSFENNKINGNWDGDPATYDKAGLDSGIMVEYENGDRIIGNTIQNCYDAGVETIGTIQGLEISRNTISGMGVSAIGTYWFTSWDNVAIENNRTSDAPNFLVAVYQDSRPYGPVPDVVQFTNVSIRGNSFTSPRPPIITRFSPSMHISIPTSFPPGPGHPTSSNVGHNILADNHFDTSIPGPYFDPPDAFTDGGGNVWAMPPPPEFPSKLSTLKPSNAAGQTPLILPF